jgi:hypothetical protein
VDGKIDEAEPGDGQRKVSRQGAKPLLLGMRLRELCAGASVCFLATHKKGSEG